MKLKAGMDSSNYVFGGLGYMIKRKLWIWQDTTRYSQDTTKYVVFNVGYNLQISFASTKLLSDDKKRT